MRGAEKGPEGAKAERRETWAIGSKERILDQKCINTQDSCDIGHKWPDVTIKTKFIIIINIQLPWFSRLNGFIFRAIVEERLHNIHKRFLSIPVMGVAP